MAKHILLAEDDEHISEVMKIILEDAGYRVDIADSKVAIDAAITKQTPDLLFLDVRLGGESGEDIAESFKKSKKTASIRLIIVSADDRTKEIADKVGADGFLLKPFDMNVLLDLVKTQLHR